MIIMKILANEEYILISSGTYKVRKISIFNIIISRKTCGSPHKEREHNFLRFLESQKGKVTGRYFRALESEKTDYMT